MQETDREKLNKTQIELHLKSAVEALTPNVLDRIDLSTPQDVVPRQETAQPSNIVTFNRRMRGIVLATAACLCVMVMGGGAFHYQYQNRKVDSVIGIDVNPSVELSVNRKEKVLSAEALNEDARAVMEGMDLEGVDLNVAVNAVIGSMVTHGYLDDLDNAILVTVSNDSISKASRLRTSVVGDIEKTLEENQVQAVVYDQQVIELDEMKALADEYGISYGKAYFLKELIDQNADLTMEDMDELSSLSMEEIAKRITESSYALGEFADKAPETTAAPTTQTETETEETTTAEDTEASSEETTEETTAVPPETTVQTTAQTEPETEEDVVEPDRVEIDYVDYEDGKVYVYFVTRVKWKNPTVSVKDEEGNSYAAMVDETSGGECVIEVSGLEGGKSYSFVLGGLIPVEGGSATTVKGYFDKPEIAGEATEPDVDGGEDETSAPETTAPDVTGPDATVPDTGGSETAAPETGRPDETTGQEMKPSGEEAEPTADSQETATEAEPSEEQTSRETGTSEQTIQAE